MEGCKGQCIEELKENVFSGGDNEDAHEHIGRILEIIDLFHASGASKDHVMGMAFPFTLKGKAKKWMRRLPTETITTWELLKKAFLEEYRPPTKIIKQIKNIRGFQQEVGEPLSIRKMHKYAKFVKDLLTNKEKLKETSKLALNERCSAVLLNEIPLEERDPWSFTIPCAIGKLVIDKALADLGVEDVVKDEIVKLLDARFIYVISDSPWISLIHVVPKKGGMTMITNEKNELVPTRTVTEWRVCIDYRKLNNATRKDHFPLPFVDQMLERLSEFTIEIKDKKGAENLVVDHLSRLENPELEELNEKAIRDSFSGKHLMEIQLNKPKKYPWYVDYDNNLVSRIMPRDMTYHLKKKLFSDLKYYIWDEPYLFKSYPDGVIRRYVFGKELDEIMEHCHIGPSGRHYEADITTRKIIEAGFC
ncbi:reverse transcriptase domain-containing protein [Tanacetum coccineum]